MPDPTDSNPSEPFDDDLSQSLAELAELIKPISNEKKFGIDAYFYLLLLWASFHVYPLEPPPDTTGFKKPKIIKVEGGWTVFDYGDSLSTSPGEDYGSYCTGKLIRTAQEMIKILESRGVTKVGFLGHDVARRAAWIECLEHNIAIINYEPTDFDWDIRYRIAEMRKKTEKIKQKAAAKFQRMEPD